MSFYKIVKDGMIVGVCTDADFRRFQQKHRIIVISDADRVEAVDYGGTLYHDVWMAEPSFPYEGASVIEITKEKYDSLKAQLDDGDISDDGSLDDEVEPSEQETEPKDEGDEKIKKTAAQILQEQIKIVDSQVKLAARFASV